jgi:hypothetical protein
MNKRVYDTQFFQRDIIEFTPCGCIANQLLDL